MSAQPDVASGERVVLVVDDEPALVEVLRMYLESEGFRVISAGDGHQALALTREARPDIILLDVNLPRLSGVEVLRTIRAESSVPVIMVTSRVHEVDRVVGLELGADDYVSKPFSPREVVARVKAVLRRARVHDERTPAHHDVVRVSAIEIDRSAYEVRRNGAVVDVTPTEFRVLNTLATHAGQALSREQILNAICADGNVYDRTLDRHIANLRHKIEEEPARPKLILTVVGVGYKLVDPGRAVAH